MKKALLLVLSLAACGQDGDSNEPITQTPNRYDTPAEKPTQMKIDPALKTKFVADCEAAATNSPEWYIYSNIATDGRDKTCADRFNILANERAAKLGILTYNNSAPLEFLPFLESLEVLNPADGLEAKISKMPNLQKLFIQRTNLSDLSFLTNLRYLNSVAISDSPVKNVSLLEPLTNLRYLYLANLRDKQGKPTLAKDETHCPVNSKNEELNFACKRLRAEK